MSNNTSLSATAGSSTSRIISGCSSSPEGKQTSNSINTTSSSAAAVFGCFTTSSPKSWLCPEEPRCRSAELYREYERCENPRDIHSDSCLQFLMEDHRISESPYLPLLKNTPDDVGQGCHGQTETKGSVPKGADESRNSENNEEGMSPTENTTTGDYDPAQTASDPACSDVRCQREVPATERMFPVPEPEEVNANQLKPHELYPEIPKFDTQNIQFYSAVSKMRTFQEEKQADFTNPQTKKKLLEDARVNDKIPRNKDESNVREVSSSTGKIPKLNGIESQTAQSSMQNKTENFLSYKGWGQKHKSIRCKELDDDFDDKNIDFLQQDLISSRPCSFCAQMEEDDYCRLNSNLDLFSISSFGSLQFSKPEKDENQNLLRNQVKESGDVSEPTPGDHQPCLVTPQQRPTRKETSARDEGEEGVSKVVIHNHLSPGRVDIQERDEHSTESCYEPLLNVKGKCERNKEEHTDGGHSTHMDEPLLEKENFKKEKTTRSETSGEIENVRSFWESEDPEDQELQKTVHRILHPVFGVDVKDREWLWCTIPHAVVGSDLIRWLMLQHGSVWSYTSAKAYAQRMLDRGAVIPFLSSEQRFIDEWYYSVNSPN